MNRQCARRTPVDRGQLKRRRERKTEIFLTMISRFLMPQFPESDKSRSHRVSSVYRSKIQSCPAGGQNIPFSFSTTAGVPNMAAPLCASLADRIQDLAGEDLRNFNPITGFIDAPLLSLPDAIASISRASADADPMLPTRVELACDFADGILLDCEDSGEVELLQRDEIAAIHLYTQNTSFYSQLNQLLRSRARQMLKPFAPYLKLLLGGLQKLPRVDTTVFRGIKGNLSPSYKKGTKFVWWALSSTTATIDCLSNPQFFGPSGERTLFTIAVKHAVDISRYSSLPSENELVLVPGSRMRVVGSVLNADGSCIIQCEEVSPPLGFFEFEERAVIGASNACGDNHAYSDAVADATDNVMVSKGSFLPAQPHKEIAQGPTLPVNSHSTSAPVPPLASSAGPISPSVNVEASSSVPVPSHAVALSSVDIARTLVEGRLKEDRRARPGDRVNLRLQLCDSAGMFVLQTGHRWRVVIQARDVDADENAETLAAQQNVQVQDTGMGTYKVSFNAVAGPRRLLIVSETTGQCIPHFDFEVGVPPPIPQPAVVTVPVPSTYGNFQHVADAASVPAVAYCGPTCTIRHDVASSLCGRCSKPAGQHHGHICMTGQRGTFLVPIAAQIAAAAAMVPASMQGQRPPSKVHTGEWRGDKHPKWCAKEVSDGKLCTHGSKTLLRYHWYAVFMYACILDLQTSHCDILS